LHCLTFIDNLLPLNPLIYNNMQKQRSTLNAQRSTLNAFSNFKTFDRLKVPRQCRLQCNTNHPYSFLIILLLVLNFNCQKDDSVQQN
jgi:hypothetical protein